MGNNMYTDINTKGRFAVVWQFTCPAPNCHSTTPEISGTPPPDGCTLLSLPRSIREGLINLRKEKQRIVTESVRSALGFENDAFSFAAKNFERLSSPGRCDEDRKSTRLNSSH